MKNPKYREAMADVYRLVEDFEDVPPIGDDRQDEFWEKCSKALEDFIGKYPGMPEIQEWALGIYAGFERIAKGSGAK